MDHSNPEIIPASSAAAAAMSAASSIPAILQYPSTYSYAPQAAASSMMPAQSAPAASIRLLRHLMNAHALKLRVGSVDIKEESIEDNRRSSSKKRERSLSPEVFSESENQDNEDSQSVKQETKKALKYIACDGLGCQLIAKNLNN